MGSWTGSYQPLETNTNCPVRMIELILSIYQLHLHDLFELVDDWEVEAS